MKKLIIGTVIIIVVALVLLFGLGAYDGITQTSRTGLW